MTFKPCRGINSGGAHPTNGTSGAFCWFAAGTKGLLSLLAILHHPPPPHSSSVRQSIYKPTNKSKQPTRPDLCCVLWWRLTAPQAPVSRDVSISAVRRAWCCCRPLFSNPLLQFSQGKLHLFPSCRLIPRPMPLPCLPCSALLCLAAALFTHLHELDTPLKKKKTGSACRQPGSSNMQCVYLGDLNPAGTGEQWGSHSPS